MRKLLAVALLALALPAAASAHATLVKTAPAYGKRVERSPALVRLYFDQSVDVLPNAIRVYDVRGRLLSGKTLASADKRTIDAPVSRLPRGGYTVRWRAVSADGHVVSGVFTFGVRMRAPPATEAFGAGGPTTTEHLVRWLYFVAIALLAGGLGFRLLIVRGPLGEAAQRRFYQLLGVGVIGALEVGIVAFLLRAEDALQLPFVNFLYGDLSPLAKTRFGYAFVAMTLGYRARRGARLPGLAERPRAGCSGRPSCSRWGSRRAFRSRATPRRTPARRRSRSSRTGCTSRRRRSGSAGSCSSRS